jgi:hypothetical protein
VLPLPNDWLHLAVLFGAGLQILTIALPSLRLLLGLEPLGLPGLLWTAGGVLVSWMAAEVFSRFAWARTHQSALNS